MSQRGRNRRVTHPKALQIVIVGAVLAVVLLFVFRSVFAIRSVQVQGNSYCTVQEVVASSGIKVGESIFSVKESQVRENINKNRYLEFVSVWREYFPSTVIITVTEHAPQTKFMWMGVPYLVGDHWIVLEDSQRIDYESVHVPEIIGMTVSQARVGQEVVYGVAGQADAIRKVVEALALEGIMGDIVDINVTSPDSIMMRTEAGLQIALGDDNQLGEKMAYVGDLLPRLATFGSLQGALLDVSSGQSADFRPAAE